MSEMLGNQYFLAGRFEDAIIELEKTLLQNPDNYSAKKKLIISYLQVNKLESSLLLFAEVINKDINIIIETDPVKDCCPCPDIIYSVIKNDFDLNEDEKYLRLGILWLYCDAEESLSYFNKIITIGKWDDIIRKIKNKLSCIKQPHYKEK